MATRDDRARLAISRANALLRKRERAPAKFKQVDALQGLQQNIGDDILRDPAFAFLSDLGHTATVHVLQEQPVPAFKVVVG